MVKYSSEIQDIVMMATFIDLCVLDYYGIVYMMDRCIRYNKRSLTFFCDPGRVCPGAEFDLDRARRAGLFDWLEER